MKDRGLRKEKVNNRIRTGEAAILFMAVCLLAFIGCLLTVRPVKAAEDKTFTILYAADNKKTPIEGAEFSADIVAVREKNGSYRWVAPYHSDVAPDKISEEETKTLPDSFRKLAPDKGAVTSVTGADGKCTLVVKQNGIYLIWQSGSTGHAEDYEEAKPLLAYMPQVSDDGAISDAVALEPKTAKKNKSDSGKTDTQPDEPAITDKPSGPDSGKTVSEVDSKGEKPTITGKPSKPDSGKTNSTTSSTVVPGQVGAVRLIKVDAQNHKKVLPGAEFDLYRANNTQKGTLVGHYKTDKSGKISISGLGYDRYWFIETKAPAGYMVNASKIRFQLNETTSPGNAYPWQITFENVKGKGTISPAQGKNNATKSSSTTIKGIPVKTGDYNGIILWAALIAGSGICLIVISAVNRKHREGGAR